MVTCPRTPYTSPLLSSSCSSPRRFGLDFLQTPPHDDTLALLLTFGSANTWYRDAHPTRFVPCPAHTHQAHLPGPLQELDVTRNGNAAPGQVQHLVRRRSRHGLVIVCCSFTSAQTERSSFNNASAAGPEEAGFWPVTSLPSTWT